VNKSDRVGIDVSKDWLDVERARECGEIEGARFENSGAGHRKLCRWLTKRGRTARVVVEATGAYHYKAVVALAGSKGVEVMVVNPMAVSAFGKALLQRAKTDTTSAHVLREFAQRMEFVRWVAPSRARSELRALSRRVEALTEMKAQEKNRLHAAQVDGEPGSVLKDIRTNIESLKRRVEQLRTQALKTIGEDQELQGAYTLLRTITGIGDASAISILAELERVSTDLDVRQWVAYAGLDPRPVESGTSVKMPRRISKVGNVHLRRALYMPALVAIRRNAQVKAFAEHLAHKGKSKLVVIVAVMRKLLHTIYGMLKHRVAFDPQKFYRTLPLVPA